MADKQFGRYKRSPKTARYWNTNQRLRNKLKRILRSSGVNQATAYAKQFMATGILRELTR